MHHIRHESPGQGLDASGSDRRRHTRVERSATGRLTDHVLRHHLASMAESWILDDVGNGSWDRRALTGELDIAAGNGRCVAQRGRGESRLRCGFGRPSLTEEGDAEGDHRHAGEGEESV